MGGTGSSPKKLIFSFLFIETLSYNIRMAEINPQVSQLDHIFFNARKTCLEMLVDRKYQVPPHWNTLTENNFTIDQDDVIYGITDLQNKPVVVFLTNGSIADTLKRLNNQLTKLKINGINGIEDFMTFNQCHLIIIYDEDQDPKFTTLEGKCLDNPSVELFDVRRIAINPTKHIFQPKFRLMSEDEISKVLRYYEANSKHPSKLLLGSICLDDPITRYYGGFPPQENKPYGDVFEIIRDGSHIFYRKVTSKRMNLKTKRNA